MLGSGTSTLRIPAALAASTPGLQTASNGLRGHSGGTSHARAGPGRRTGVGCGCKGGRNLTQYGILKHEASRHVSRRAGQARCAHQKDVWRGLAPFHPWVVALDNGIKEGEHLLVPACLCVVRTRVAGGGHPKWDAVFVQVPHKSLRSRHQLHLWPHLVVGGLPLLQVCLPQQREQKQRSRRSVRQSVPGSGWYPYMHAIYQSEPPGSLKTAARNKMCGHIRINVVQYRLLCLAAVGGYAGGWVAPTSGLSLPSSPSSRIRISAASGALFDTPLSPVVAFCKWVKASRGDWLAGLGARRVCALGRKGSTLTSFPSSGSSSSTQRSCRTSQRCAG